MIKMFTNYYVWECALSRSVNQLFDRKPLNLFFRTITHMGGATFTISIVLATIFLTNDWIRLTAIASAIALSFSHIPVTLAKKYFPRQRPYLALTQMKVGKNPLKDHSFPSGHTTAIFSIITPFIYVVPTLALLLIPIGVSVGLSRIFLGLHYPSDVLAGCMLGCSSGYFALLLINYVVPYGLL